MHLQDHFNNILFFYLLVREGEKIAKLSDPNYNLCFNKHERFGQYGAPFNKVKRYAKSEHDFDMMMGGNIANLIGIDPERR